LFLDVRPGVRPWVRKVVPGVEQDPGSSRGGVPRSSAFDKLQHRREEPMMLLAIHDHRVKHAPEEFSARARELGPEA
jgi:hypothetical protein